MGRITSAAVLLLAALPALAETNPPVRLAEPETLVLLGIGAIAMLLGRRK